MNIRLILALLIAAHGVGHLLGVMIIPMGMLQNNGFNQSSWLLSNKLELNERIVKMLGFLWLIAALAFTASAYGYFYELAWWETAIKTSMVISLALFVSWWNAFPSNIPIQANLGNIVALIALYLKA